MTVCKFYLKGCCRFGRNCRFEHPGEDEYEQRQHYSSHNSASNFSFKSALNEVVSAPSSTSNPGFSFAAALQDTPGAGYQQSFNAADSHMQDGFSFAAAIQQVTQQPASSNFFQHQHQHQHQQPTFGSSFSSNASPFGFSQVNFQAPAQFHQPYQPAASFGAPQTAFNSAPQPASQPLSQKTLQQQENARDPNFSQPDELNELEASAFSAPKFQFRGIPVRPPPKVYC